ncbi:MAG: hypothetical protein IJC83_02175 [Oscillospiraceae bacterium]|nr:hypothetical protein [Oscillospiraceae bacterium]
MKRKIFIIVALIIIVLLEGTRTGYSIYRYYTPEVVAYKMIETKRPNPPIETIEFGVSNYGSSKFSENPPKHAKQIVEQAKEMVDAINSEVLSDKYIEPTEIRVYAEVKDDKTYFTYIGEVTTKDGKTKPYHKEIMIDYPFLLQRLWQQDLEN